MRSDEPERPEHANLVSALIRRGNVTSRVDSRKRRYTDAIPPSSILDRPREAVRAEGGTVTYAYVQDVASSWEQYAPVAAALVDPLPAGLIVHVAGRTDEGVRIIDVWESEEAWLLFRTERLAPAIAALGGPARREATFRDLYPEHVVLRNRGAAQPRGADKEER